MGVGERPRVDAAQPAVLDDLADDALGVRVIGGDQDVERLAATSPSTSVPANVVLNAFTTFAPGAFRAISWAAEPASIVSGVKVGSRWG